MRRIDHTGERFGRLLVTGMAASIRQRGGQKRAMAFATCDCGNTLVVRTSDLRNSNSQSCGCLMREITLARSVTHGHSTWKSSAYSVWCGMRDRCFNKNEPAYHRYGGRGIVVCERWNSFENFLADMGQPPAGLELERNDNNGPYSPDNCRWATCKEQARNRRSNINITIEGETLCLTEWCDRLAIPYARVRARIKKLGWTSPQALGLESRSSIRNSNISPADALT